jgi:threonine/homoserine/homoserine lactone efflux protein
MILPAMLLKGLALGVAVAAPVGPIGLLCMQRIPRQGRLAGLASGLGVATADALYAAAPVLPWPRSRPSWSSIGRRCS